MLRRQVMRATLRINLYMKLVIVESPAKAKTIEKYLGKDYTVRASVGHIRDLPKSSKNAIDIEGGFIPNYKMVEAKDDVVSELKKIAKKSDETILATDPDREGEAIAWHVAEALKLKNPKRIVFNEITESAVQNALKHPRIIDDSLRKAQEARRVLDRLFGYDLSGLIWKKVRYGLSAGRVQSPALRIIMEREREIRAFIPEDYWLLTAKLKAEAGNLFEAFCSEEPREEKEAKRIVKEAESGKWKVMSITEKESKRSPRPPFTTSTLQQVSSTRLGYSPSNTMRIAQKLYEAGHITYMRTDSPTLGGEAQITIVKTVQDEFGKDYAEARIYKTKSKSAQEAHEAIRPTNPAKVVAGTTDDQKKLYKLIRARALASQMADAIVMRTNIKMNIEGESIPMFVTRGSRVIFDGWLKADPAARGEDVEVPKIVQGEPLTLVSIDSEGKQTQPPNRFTEAGLIKELESRGIGRPSTYASIMRTINDRGYVEKEGRTLIPTDTGDVVSSFLEEHFTEYISDDFTAEMENELDEIAEGKREYAKTLGDFYKPFTKAVNAKEDIPKLTSLGDVSKEFPCPICKGDMEFKLSKNGRFMSCKDFPECHGARKADGTEIEPPKEIGEKCPDCGEGELIEREGKYGRFVGCERYPKCKYVRQDENNINSTGVKCPDCDKGEIVEKRGRYGPFFACSNYPDCKHAMKTKPTGNKCEMCGKLMMEGTKTIPERCEDKACLNHRPDKLEKK
jgi:DNA topoisomerase I